MINNQEYSEIIRFPVQAYGFDCFDILAEVLYTKTDGQVEIKEITPLSISSEQLKRLVRPNQVFAKIQCDVRKGK